jgi:hypothetical protein
MNASTAVDHCLHRQKRLLVDLAHSQYQVMCATCLILTAEWPSGMRAWQAWLHDRKVDWEVQRLLGP